MRIYLQTPVVDDRPPRFYHLFLQQDLLDGWTLVREWGHQGSPGRLVKEQYASREQAEEALIRYRNAQLKRGYKVMFVQGQEQL